MTKDVETFALIIRSHWGIENSLHYVKDVTFYEDSCRMRTGQIPFVATLLRSQAIGLMNRWKVGNLKAMRKQLAWDPELLFSLLEA